ncbi:MAG: (Fe-S)-binding protein [Deltaproteobacteria bacterium]|nr:(Fe-S)-binding protein [Deltaproteobacteria bacterium]
MKRHLTIEEFSRPSEQLARVDIEDLIPLPPPYDGYKEPEWTRLKDEKRASCECSLDDTVLLSLPKPKSLREERELADKFVAGLQKLFTKENNWTFLQPLVLSMEHCAKCQTCSDACHVFLESGGNDVYRPTYRAEILRRLYYRHVREGGLLSGLTHGRVGMTWTTVARLIELAYRCNLCRRCAQTCPIGVDNALIAREIRKLCSQELGIAPKELHEKGTMLQLSVGSTTGMNSLVVKDNMDFIDEDMSEKTGVKLQSKWDVEGADVLLIHNAGEILAWPENPGAFALILEAAGISWTLSSELAAYDGVNYGLFYDDAQFARIALLHAQAAKKLGVKKIVAGECGHEHKALMVIADRVLTGDLNIPRESSFVLLEEIVNSGKLKLDPSRNNFPVTLHDPCNVVRLMGIVEPQRRILRKIAPQFREMEPHGVDNYCCGGGSGFAIMSGNNFAEWRMKVSGRRKFRQILEAFRDEPDPAQPKYVCAPCSNCKGQIRDLFAHYGAKEKVGLHYGGLVELIVNAMTDVKPGFMDFDAG